MPKHNNFAGKSVLIMGLGLHGGGLQSIRYMLSLNAQVTCTDLRTQHELKKPLESLKNTNVHFVLGEHRQEDFDKADIIIKNPGVPSDSPWLRGRTNIETDISIFLQAIQSPIIAITGSKGKSTTVSALHHLLKRRHPGVKLGGNITVSPLAFIDDLNDEDPVILELSSWQLHDLQGRGHLRPKIACITNLMHDHQDRYKKFSDYEKDKKVIMENIPITSNALFPDNNYGHTWAKETACPVHLVNTQPGTQPSNQYSTKQSANTQDNKHPNTIHSADFYLDPNNCGWHKTPHKPEKILPHPLSIPGSAFRTNLLFAAAIAKIWGCPAEEIVHDALTFKGIPYRMELFLEHKGIKFYDDTASTIPDATLAAVTALPAPCILIAGGTDKKLDFSPLSALHDKPELIVLLAGSATQQMQSYLPQNRTTGPFNSMEEAVHTAIQAAKPGTSIVLSPGAASFEMFQNEFQRGDAYKNACRSIVNRI